MIYLAKTSLVLIFLLTGSSFFIPSECIAEDSHVASKIQVEWTQCKNSDECVVIRYGCFGKCAVNKASEKLARQVMWKSHGDPSVLDCIVLGDLGDKELAKGLSSKVEAACHANHCNPVCEP